jgi:hypothetical protein
MEANFSDTLPLTASFLPQPDNPEGDEIPMTGRDNPRLPLDLSNIGETSIQSAYLLFNVSLTFYR